MTDGHKISRKAWRGTEKVPYSVKFQGHTGQKNCHFLPESSIPELQLQFELTDGFGIMDKAWHSIKEVPYCFSNSSIQFQSNTAR